MEAILPVCDVPTFYVFAMHNIEVLYQCIWCDDNNQSINRRRLEALSIKVALLSLTFNSREFIFCYYLVFFEKRPLKKIHLL